MVENRQLTTSGIIPASIRGFNAVSTAKTGALKFYQRKDFGKEGPAATKIAPQGIRKFRVKNKGI